MRYVFVYGTLRAGEINDIVRAAARHDIEAPRLTGTAAVRGRLYDFGLYPGLVLDAAAAGLVHGDVYEIDDALVPVLDEIEEVYPGVEGLFKSREVTVAVDGRNLTCLYYPVDAESVAGLPRIEIGDWVEYRLTRDAEPALG
ncbi:gamma-glutamylcyclotransferase family protein [Trinickia symbiotica]|uniref:Gamma-glutamylcyclotransferase n=1 Tax=Trinickia symbiotica TaxID=863227 RepID=A0A2N7X0G2_9BURK|nr:gamma-glutamylcyclotransferase [Trinickia symbiotica]PMS35219.1 gamma-glutamylcyclotransferase [Trinickia symbiotica]